MHQNPLHRLIAVILIVIAFIPAAVWAADTIQDQDRSTASVETPLASLVVDRTNLSPDNSAEPIVPTLAIPSLVLGLENLRLAKANLNILTPEDSNYCAARDQVSAAEKTLQEEFARRAGLGHTDVATMREEGLGWRDIAEMLNIAPGVFGLDVHLACSSNGKQGQGQNISATADLGTSRSLTGGFAKDHGLGMDGESYQKQGLGAQMYRAGTGGPDTNLASGNSSPGFSGSESIGGRFGGLGDGSGSKGGKGDADGGTGGGIGGRGDSSGDGRGGKSA